MVIGNGLIASGFEKYKDNNNVLIFAAGVSNSLETDNKIFYREEHLLTRTIKLNWDKTFVYFSSNSYYSNSSKKSYFMHKLEMEDIVNRNCGKRIIMKLPQVIGHKGNPNTLFNFIHKKLINDEEIPVYENSHRSLIDIDDLEKIIREIINLEIYGTFTINGIEVLEIEEIVRIMAGELNIIPKIKLIPTDHSPKEDNSYIINSMLNKLNINKKDYIKNLIKKYIL